MRQPINKTKSKKKPLYGGVAQRYRGQQVWVAGWHPSMDAYRAAFRAACDRLDREFDGAPQTGAADKTIGEYAQHDWLRMHSRPKESTNTKLGGAKRTDEQGRTVRTSGDIKPLVVQYGDKTFGEIDYFDARSWAAGIPTNNLKAARALWNDAMEDLKGVYNPPLLNPFSGHRRNESRRGRGGKNITVLTGAEVDLLCDSAREAWPGPFGENLAALVLWLALTCVRPSEAFATEWEWLYLDQNEAEIYPWVRDMHTGEIEGKTVSASRRI